jgi:acyl carrier protein
MQPSAYVLLDSLPVTSEGKVDRRRLPALEVAHPPAQPDAPPRNEAERKLAAIAQQILQVDGVGIHQNFFELGGDSVHMVKIMNEVREAFGREVPITEIFRHPTISSLAGYLSADDAAEPAGADSDQRASQHRAAVARRNANRRRERPAPGPDGAVQT